ncbi:MAG: DNA primase [Capnocytophaga sp.]|nr:DNA primase [Capnocytophaga sp.]
MITKESIDKVYDAIRVEEVLEDFIQLKRAGANFKALSPFSNEQTPSLMVSPSKQIWKDFSSGKGGNAIAFLMEHERFSYVEAIRYLAKKYNIELEETQASEEELKKNTEKENLYIVSEYARDYFKKTLWESEEGKAIGMTYFKERGFSEETIQTFQLGYSPDSWTAFTDEALQKGYKLENLDKTGLTIVKENKKYDAFRGRVMFPILSMSGRVLGFGGRILTNDKKTAKYLNSPESEIYHKSKILYGIFYAKQHIAKEDNCFLVEGYTDMIQMYQKGIKNVVASSGTALTSEQISLIHRLTSNVTILYDGDSAGLRATIRAADMILEQGMNVRICVFPEGEDPDSFAKKHSLTEIKEYFEGNMQDFIRFKAYLLVKESKNDPLQRAETIRDMITSISKIPDIIKREIYVRECATIMNISEEVLFTSLSQIGSQQLQQANKEFKRKQQNNLQIVKNQPIGNVNSLVFIEKDLIKHLLLYGTKECVFEDVRLAYDEKGEEITQIFKQKLKVFEKFFLELQADEIELSTPNFKNIFKLILEKYKEEENFNINRFINEIPLELAQEVAGILAEDSKLQLHNWKEKDIITKDKDADVPIAVNAIILRIRRLFVMDKIKTLQKELEKEKENEEFDSKEIIKEIMDYLFLQKLINKKLNQVVN